MLIRLLAVDPGEVFVGYAEFVGTDCMNLDCQGPDDAIDTLWGRIRAGHYDFVVAEQWRTYGDESAVWSECRTAEVNGALRHYCRRYGVPFTTQPARIMRPGLARARHAGIAFPDEAIAEAPGLHRPHMRSAWIHGAWWLCHRGLDCLERQEVG